MLCNKLPPNFVIKHYQSFISLKNLQFALDLAGRICCRSALTGTSAGLTHVAVGSTAGGEQASSSPCGVSGLSVVYLNVVASQQELDFFLSNQGSESSWQGTEVEAARFFLSCLESRAVGGLRSAAHTQVRNNTRPADQRRGLLASHLWKLLKYAARMCVSFLNMKNVISKNFLRMTLSL